MLPDVTGWAYGGSEPLGGRETQVWVLSQRHQAKHVEYRFYVTPEGSPVRLHMHGNDLFSGAHFDEWVADFDHYAPGPPERSLFEEPELCDGVAPGGGAAAGRRAAHTLRWAGLLPSVAYRGEDPVYDAFLSSHGAARRHGSLAEYRRRAELHAANAARIEAHNAANRSYTMAMNKFGDWTRAEFHAVMLPKRAKQGRGAARQAGGGKLGRGEVEYRALTDPALVPASISWRGSGADTVVADQVRRGRED